MNEQPPSEEETRAEHDASGEFVPPVEPDAIVPPGEEVNDDLPGADEGWEPEPPDDLGPLKYSGL